MIDDPHDGARRSRLDRWRSRGRRRLLRLAVVALVLAGGLALALWMLRDLPRRLLEQALSDRLSARVRIEGLRLRPQIALSGVTIREMRTLPTLETASTPRIVVHGHWRALLRGEIERLEIPEATARLRPVCGRPLELTAPRAHVERIDLGSLDLEVVEGAKRASLHLEGTLENPEGRGLEGTFAVRAPELDILPLAALWRPELSPRCAGSDRWPDLRLERATGELVLARGARAAGAEPGPPGLRLSTRLEAARASAVLEGQELVLPDPTLDATLTLAAATRAEAVLRAPGVERATFDLELAPGDGSGTWRATVTGLDLEPWLLLAGTLGAPGELRGAGTLTGEIESSRRGAEPGADAAALAFRATARLDRLDASELDGTFSTVRAGGLVVEAYGQRLARPAADLTFRATARLDRLEAAASEGPVPAVRAGGIVVDASGRRPAQPGRAATDDDLDPRAILEGKVEARIERFAAEIPPGSVGRGLAGFGGLDPGDLSWLAPLRAGWQGTVWPGRLGGDVRLQTAALGSWQMQGELLLAGADDPGAGAPAGAQDAGPARDGGARAAVLDAAWSWSGERLEVLAERWRSLGGEWPEDLEVSGSARARGRVRGPLGAPAITARLDLEEPAVSGSLAGRALAAEAPALALSLESEQAAELRASGLDPVTVRLAFADRPPLETLLTFGDAHWTGERAALDRLEVDARALGRVVVRDVRVEGSAAARRAKGDLEAAGMNLPVLLDWWVEEGATAADPATTLATPSERTALEEIALEGELEGVASAELRWSWQADATWSAEGHAAVGGGGWSSADGSRAIAGFEPRLDLSARRTGQEVAVRVGGPVGGLQVLWDAVFLDYTDRYVGLEASGTVSTAAETSAEDASQAQASPTGSGRTGEAPAWLAGRDARAAVRLVGSGLDARWRASQRADSEPEMELTLDLDDLGEAWRAWVRDPLEGSGTIAEEIRLDGSARLELQGSSAGEAWRVGGSLEVSQTAATLDDDAEVRGLAIDLPLDLLVRRGAEGLEVSPPAAGAGELEGSLRFDRLRAGGVEVTPVDAALAVRGDRLALRDRLRVPLFGGVVGLDALSISGLLGAEPALEADVSAVDVDLMAATEAMGLFPLEGELNARFPRVRLAGGRLETEVEGVAAVFGGRVEVTELEGSDLFESFPRLEISARFEDIHLSQVTRTLEFGEITGLVRGEVEDLELVGGTPVRFNARLRSMPTEGVEQRVSIRAINNIALLGTGSDVSVLQRGIRRLFDSYPYRALGIELSLRRDDFLLRGLERRGERELFLKGRWPLRLDIVNVKPGTRVSFSTMMRRLGNLEIERGGGGAASSVPP
ncbi:MAG TPA: hypothetical protein VMT85_04155 [Thermoanaerobaculia bacterium]|nr:hypothetical protein [Thermoanaerobaculia bacterium]